VSVAQLEHIEAIEKRLWGTADTLRANSNYASNEYFLLVMGLVFLRHTYSRFLAVKEKIEANLPTRVGKTRALSKEDFSQQSSIFLQPEAQFGQLLRTLNPDVLKKVSGDVFGRIYEYFLTQFSDQKAHDGG